MMLTLLTRGWFKALSIGVFLLVALWLFGGMTGGLLRELAQSRTWIKQPDFTEASKESEDLFKELVRDNILWLDTTVPALRNQPCEAIFEPSLSIQRPNTQPFRRKQLERMCNQPAGRQILDEILVWNSSFLIAAVRDDRATNTRCADGSQLDLPVVPPGCRPAPWAASIVQAGGFTSPLTPIPGAVPPPRDFADFASGRVRSLSDWAMFGPLRDAEDRLSITSRLPAGNRRVIIEMILNPTRITIGGQSANFDNKRESLTVNAGGLSISAERICDEDEFENCAEAMTKGLPQGWRLTVNGRRARDTDITFEGTPVRAVPPNASEVLTGAGGATGKVRLWRSAQIEANCERDRSKLDCQLSWRTSVTQQRRGGGGRRVAFADGSPAIDASGKPVPDVDEMGLTALIGYGPSDIGSLTSAIGNARTREPLVLTIEPRLQKLAQEAIYEKMGARLDRGARRKRIVAGTPEEREPPDQGDGRAAVVLMDAGDAPGEILAVAGWPEFRPGMHSWDIMALSSGREGDSPLAGHPWRAGDVHAMPGSTFKLVSGLAGITATKTIPWAADVVLGKEPPARQMARLGIGASALVVDGFTISNYGGGAFAGAILPPGPGGSGCPVNNAGSQVSVCEALIKSSNLWFAGLELGIDGSKVTARPPERPSGRTGTFLAAAAERIFPISQPPATPLVPGLNPRGVDMTRGIVPGALRLYAEPIDLAVEDKRNGRRIDLATNSYGQGVRATPMAMVTIYGSVGARRVIAPRILRPVSDVQETKTQFEGQRIIPGMDASEDKRWLDHVDAGLHGVSNSPYGTAVGAMSVVPPAIRTRVYGKTGTADTSPGMNSAWFAGWINDAAGRRRIAFVCWVSHTQLSGGKACGQLMAPLLAKIGALSGRS
jgi:cell division protein FtsI/penicillin-binding protein 2